MGILQDVPAWIKELPIIQQEIARKKELEIDRRREAAARIAKSKATADAVIPGLIEKVDQARAAIVAHDAARKTLQGRLAAAAAALANKRHSVESEIRQAETVLLETYDAGIDEAISYFRDSHETLRSKSADESRHRGENNIFTMSKAITIFSNRESIVAALKFCREAIATLEGMKLAPAVDLGKIDALKKGIPDAGTLTEYQTSKPLPPLPPDPMEVIRLNEESGTSDYERKKLREKTKKLMSRAADRETRVAGKPA